LEQEEREMEEYQQKKERERLEKIEETKQNICPRCGDDARREMDITKPHSVWNCCPKCGKN
jgi:ribosomal protein S27AE